ncbi:MAG: hypothetical protein KatS3mg059_1515 [Thermomicrobiales bacterium]|nr:MAG: hypothetical protein KatS3mg059_1515 [Thermomicrobiales bacterium]
MLVGVGGQSGNVIRFQPPLVISESDLSHAIDVLDRALVTQVARMGAPR